MQKSSMTSAPANRISYPRDFRYAVDQHAIVSVADATGRIIEVNDLFCRISGYNPDELLGQDHRLLNSGLHPREFFVDMWRALGNGQVWHGTLRNRRKDGQYYWVETTIVPFCDDEGTPYQYVSIRTDVTKLTQLQLQLAQAEKLAAIGQLAAGVAHEINNPISFVQSNIGALKDYLQDIFRLLDAYAVAESTPSSDGGAHTDVQRLKEEIALGFMRDDLTKLLDETKEGLKRVSKIVQDLRDFSDIDGFPEWQLADLHQGLDAALNVINREIKLKVEVLKDYGEIPQVECLVPLLNQVFMNLLVNAIEAMDGRIPGKISLRTGLEGEMLWLEITDTGCGISADNLKKIFDPFFTTKKIGKGTGMGLSICYGIIERHHGRIEAKSQLGEGATFRIYLPRRQPESKIR